jgi:hypothetical protein
LNVRSIRILSPDNIPAADKTKPAACKIAAGQLGGPKTGLQDAPVSPGNSKTVGGRTCKTGNRVPATVRCRCRITLAPQPKRFDNRAVALDIIALDVVEQSATFADQHQQSPTGMVIFLVHFQVLGQIGNPVREQTDLDFWRTRVGVVLFVFFNEFFFGFRCVRQCFVLLKLVAG